MKDSYILQKKSDIGLIREKNEDAGIVLVHPKNNAIKLLAIADGMGGKDLGDVASSYVISEIGKWFKSSSPSLISDTSKLSTRLKEHIKNLNSNLISKYGYNKLGTTLTLVIINEKETLILNIGDSRCYIWKDELKQITEDDSQVWLYYRAGEVNKEDLRFFSTSNFISACIGLSNSLCTPSIKVIPNDSYDLILLLTDGVTDLLTDKKISELIKKNKKRDILDRIIQEAVYVDQKLSVPARLRTRFQESFYVPSYGKDNASGAIYIK